MIRQGPLLPLLSLSEQAYVPRGPCHPEASGALGKGVVSLPPDIQNLFSLTLQMPGPLSTTRKVSRPTVLVKSTCYLWTLRKRYKPHTGGYAYREPELGLICHLSW